jgi:branched-chain amino acid transport system permease protein
VVVLEFFLHNPDLLFFIAQAALLALSLYLPLSTGQLSLASPAFYAIGGYVAAILSTNPSHSGLVASLHASLGQGGVYGLEFILALLITGVLGVAVGIVALRLRGIYLALATIAVIEIVQVLATNLTITGGAIGIFSIPRISSLWQIWALLVLVGLGMFRLERSRIGRAFKAIREDEIAADAMGIRTTYYKVMAFTLGAMLAGFVGVMGAHHLNTWNPRQGTFDASIDYISWVIVGGSHSFLGAILGATLLTLLPETLRFLKDFRLMVDSAFLVVVTIFMPRGIVGLIAGVFRRRGRKAEAAAEAVEAKEVKR